MSEPLRVLIADDHAIVREGMTLLLETASGIEVVGEASNGREAVQAARELAPDVVLMDLRMPEMDGLAALEQLAAEQPEVGVVVLTTFNEDDLMLRALRAGAKGYLLKDTDRETLLRTIRAAGRGETLLQPEILDGALSRTRSKDGAADGGDSLLTDRELEVVRAAASGGANQGDSRTAAHLGAHGEGAPEQHLSKVRGGLSGGSRGGSGSPGTARGVGSPRRACAPPKQRSRGLVG